MPIEELADNHLVQRCAACAVRHTHTHEQLAPKPSDPEGPPRDPRVIALPPCPSCGAQEFLVRSGSGEPDATAPGSYGHLHHLLVDRLHDALVSGPQAARDAEPHAPVPMRVGPPVDEADLKRWFPNGLKLPPLGKP